MTDAKQGPGVLSALALVRAGGRVYARAVAKQAAAHDLLRDSLVKAYRAGASVTELAEASGLSRPAVYRAVHPPQR